MEEIKMSFCLCGINGKFYTNNRGWYQIIDLVRLNGWDPENAEFETMKEKFKPYLMERIIDEASYLICAEGANEMADVIERALTYEAKIELHLTESEMSYKSLGWGYSGQMTDSTGANNDQTTSWLRKFIAFARNSGGFIVW
jgi:hypothetical protein